MKTYKQLYPKIHTWENLEWAYRRARRGKRKYQPAADFEYAWESNLLRLQEELAGKSYRPGPYHSFYIHEPKKRLISAAPFRDRVVHHALCRLIEPIFERRFIADSYANRVGKGTHRALDRCTTFARRYRYALSCDIKQHFPSIDHAILYDSLAKHIACPDTLWLIDQILASGVGVLAEEYDMVYFPGDDLLAANRHRGLPIGVRRESVLYDCSAQKCVSNLLFHQQYSRRYRGKVTNRVKPANNVSHTRKSAARTVRGKQVCQRQGG